MHILITRPEPDAYHLANELIKDGHQCTTSPLISLEYLDPGELNIENMQGLIITSQHALRALKSTPQLSRLSNFPIYIVGPNTASTARELGFTNIKHTAENAEKLSHYIQENCDAKDGHLLYLTGTHLAFDMAASLAPSGLQISRTIIYQTTPVADFSPTALANLNSGDIDAVLLLSPKTARQYAKLIVQNGLANKIPAITHFCLSQKIANELDKFPSCEIRIPTTPDMVAMRSLIEQNKSNLS